MPRYLISIACVAIGTLIAQSSDAPDWQATAGGKMAFEVASVKLAKPGIFVQPNMFLDNGSAKPAGGLFRGSWPLAGYIYFAYKLDHTQMEAALAQLPKW